MKNCSSNTKDKMYKNVQMKRLTTLNLVHISWSCNFIRNY